MKNNSLNKIFNNCFEGISLVNKNTICISIMILCIGSNNFAQVIDWRSSTWIDKDYGSAAPGNTPTVDQQHSDYDWWYDHCNAGVNQ